jgi:hypothetical protein
VNITPEAVLLHFPTRALSAGAGCYFALLALKAPVLEEKDFFYEVDRGITLAQG